MSLRALGSQFKAVKAKVALRNAPYLGGTQERPQGVLFGAHTLEHKLPLERATVEAGRRRMAGENNPDAPWRTPFLQHHFQERYTSRGIIHPPVQQTLPD